MRAARLLALLALAALVGRPLTAALGPRYGGDARFAVDALPGRFTPAPARGTASRLLSALAHERLVDVGPDAVATPALAEGWTEAAGGRELSLRLRRAAVFHDGTAVTPADAVRSLRGFLRSPSAAAARLAEQLEGGTAFRARAAEALPGIAAGDEAVVLRLRAPSAVALPALAAPEAAITSARGAGAGPFVPTTRGPVGARAAFVAFSRHVRGRPFLDGLALAAIPNAGDADVAAKRADAFASIDAGPLAATLVLVLDPRAAPLDRVEARRRAAAAVDGADLVEHFIPAGGRTSSLFPRALLPAPLATRRPADAPRLTGAVSLAVSTDVPAAISQRVVASLAAAGLRATARAVAPEDAWTAPAAVRLVLFVPQVADPLLALDELAALAPPADSAAGRALRAEAAAELDRDRRETLLHRAEAALRAPAVLVPLAGVPVGFRARPGLHGVAVDAAGRIRLEDAWIDP